MSTQFAKQLVRIQSKSFFVDLNSNESGQQVEISERRGSAQSTITIPVDGLEDLIDALNDALDMVEEGKGKMKSTPPPVVYAPPDDKCVFVSGFAKGTVQSDVLDFMSVIGRVASVSMKGGKKVYGAVVEYTSVELANRAVAELNETEHLGLVIRCYADKGTQQQQQQETGTKKKKKKKKNKNKKAAVVEEGDDADVAPGEEEPEPVPKVADEYIVFCTNLTFETTEEELIGHFSSVGDINSAVINLTRKGRSLGTAVIEFDDSESVAKAITELSGVELNGRVLTVRNYFNK